MIHNVPIDFELREPVFESIPSLQVSIRHQNIIQLSPKNCITIWNIDISTIRIYEAVGRMDIKAWKHMNFTNKIKSSDEIQGSNLDFTLLRTIQIHFYTSVS